MEYKEEIKMTGWKMGGKGRREVRKRVEGKEGGGERKGKRN